MSTFSLALYGVGSLGTIAIAAGYMAGDVPKAYHREILEKEGVALTPGLEAVLTALCRIVGAGLLAAAVSVFVFAAQVEPSDPLLVKIRPLLVGLIVAVPCAIMPRRVEEVTGVKTPWRTAVALTGLLFAAFAISLM